MKLMLVAVAAGVSFLICTTGIAAVKNNDNTRPAGQPRGNVVAIDMVADSDTWRPDGSKGVALAIAAFGEEVGALSVPGPLIRVRAGSTVALRLRNRLEQDLHVHGLCSRPGKCAEVSIAAGASRELRFELNAAGTYYYWASTGAARPGLRSRFESQLNGAIVVDPPDQPPADRVFVISTYDDPLPVAAGDPRILGVPTPGIPRVFAINGASWPHTERLSPTQSVRPFTGESSTWETLAMQCTCMAIISRWKLGATAYRTTPTEPSSASRRSQKSLAPRGPLRCHGCLRGQATGCFIAT